MRFTHGWAILLIGLLNTCNQASQNSITTTPDVSSASIGSSQPDTAPWVKYTTDKLKTDTTLFQKARLVKRLSDATLFEASGLAPSHVNAGCLWTEEDSGNDNEIQLLNEDGTIVARYTLDGIDNTDWEDIATGPGPILGKTYIYLAEIGDNSARHAEKIIYRFPEPAITGKQLPYEGHIKSIDIFRFTLPDGAQNAEAIILDPVQKDLFIFSKGSSSTVYKASVDLSPKSAVRMNKVLTLPFEKVTAATISNDGSELLIRTYRQLYYYSRQPGESLMQALNRAPLLIPLADEAQGEAICWALDGSGYYTTSEKTFLTNQKFYFYQRK